MAIEIEDMCSSNPKDFWERIKRLGPRKGTAIPIEVIDSNGVPINNVNIVFEKWRIDFLNLYAFQIRTRMHMMIPITFKQNTQTSY
jgi:hypothetical protein